MQDIVAVSTVITASEKCSQWKQELGIAASVDRPFWSTSMISDQPLINHIGFIFLIFLFCVLSLSLYSLMVSISKLMFIEYVKLKI